MLRNATAKVSRISREGGLPAAAAVSLRLPATHWSSPQGGGDSWGGSADQPPSNSTPTTHRSARGRR